MSASHPSRENTLNWSRTFCRVARYAGGLLSGRIIVTAGLLAAGSALTAGAARAQQVSKPASTDADRTVTIAARSIDKFQIAAPHKRQFDRLTFLGGLVLSSSDSRFGGWSGLTVSPDGHQILAVSDEGSWLSADLAHRGTKLIGIVKARMGPILALRGRKLDRKRDLDAEAITSLSGNIARGSVLIGFERNHRIGIFPVVAGTVQAPIRYLKRPAESRRMRSNKGFEAVAAFRAGVRRGEIIAFAERYPGDTSRHTGWIWIKDKPHQLHLEDIGNFEITDAAPLPNGDLIILERRFRWTEGVKMRLRLIDASTIRPGAMLKGETLLEADLTYEIDNMEGLAIHRGAAGQSILTIISDNNFNNLLQRNLLLQFALTDQHRAAISR